MRIVRVGGMVIDTSAILAILQDEPERRAFNEAIETRVMSAATLVEVSMVIEARHGPSDADVRQAPDIVQNGPRGPVAPGGGPYGGAVTGLW